MRTKQAKQAKQAATTTTDPFDEHLIYEAKKIVMSVGRMLSPFCEVLLHDLRNPQASIVAIENPISGRKIGDSATNLGLARITQPNFPDVVQNYPNVLPDGRRTKSTSIGIRGQSGRFIASICLNLETSRFAGALSLMQEFVAIDGEPAPVVEELRALSLDEVRAVIKEFSESKNVTPQKMQPKDRRELVALLRKKGLLDLKNAKAVVASALGVTRPSIYNYLGRGAGL